MPPIWSWHENSGGNGLQSFAGAWSDSGGLVISAPQSVQRIIFRYGASAEFITVDPPDTKPPAPIVAWMSLTLVDDSGTETVYTDAQPTRVSAIYTPGGLTTPPQHAFYWEGPTFSFDARVRRAAPPPPSDGLAVNWLIEGVQLEGGPVGSWHEEKYVQTYYWMRVLTSEPAV